MRSCLGEARAQALVPQWVLRPFWAHERSKPGARYDRLSKSWFKFSESESESESDSVNLASVSLASAGASIPPGSWRHPPPWVMEESPPEWNFHIPKPKKNPPSPKMEAFASIPPWLNAPVPQWGNVCHQLFSLAFFSTSKCKCKCTTHLLSWWQLFWNFFGGIFWNFFGEDFFLLMNLINSNKLKWRVLQSLYSEWAAPRSWSKEV